MVLRKAKRKIAEVEDVRSLALRSSEMGLLAVSV